MGKIFGLEHNKLKSLRNNVVYKLVSNVPKSWNYNILGQTKNIYNSSTFKFFSL